MKRIEAVFVGVVVLCAVASTAMQVVRIARPVQSNTAYLGSDDGPELIAVEDWGLLVGSGHRFGPVAAPVVIVEFGDFECPACRQFHQHALRMIRDSFADSVALVYRHWPLEYHRFALPAAQAFECAAMQGKGETMHDLLYEKQDSLGLKPFSSFARDAGVERMDEWEACNAGDIEFPQIQDDAQLIRKIGGRGTPTLIVNGSRFAHVPDAARLLEVVDSLLASAR